MDPSSLSADMLAQQLELWNQLASALEEAQAALLSGNMERFEQQTEQQRLCCDRLLANAGEANPSEFGKPGVEAILKNMRNAQKEVRRLTRIHAALLQRAGRSLVILRNLITRNGLAYAPSSFLQSDAALGGRRG